MLYLHIMLSIFNFPHMAEVVVYNIAVMYTMVATYNI